MANDSSRAHLSLVEDWRDGRLIGVRGRRKLVLASGLGSRPGDATRRLDGFIRYIGGRGIARDDVLEVSYRVEDSALGTRPIPYDPADCDAALGISRRNVVATLDWYRRRLPSDTVFHLVGFSLGGALLFEAATELLTNDSRAWNGAIGSIATFSAPLLGTDLGDEGDLLGTLGIPMPSPGGAAARELIARGRDQGFKARVERHATELRRKGVHLVTLADPDDAIVTPDDAIVAPEGSRDDLIIRADRRGSMKHLGELFGHGTILENPRAWVLAARGIHPQEPYAR
jgi:hypothetical protein